MDYIDISGWERHQVPARRPGKKSAARRKKKRKRLFLARLIFGGVILLAGILLGVILWRLLLLVMQRGTEAVETVRQQAEAGWAADEIDPDRPVIVEDFLTPNPYSRPGEKLPEVRNIFVHYTANPGTTAEQNRSYFENLGITGETSASA